VALARPWREQQEESGAFDRAHGPDLVRVELGDQPWASAKGFTVGIVDLDRASRDHEPSPLVHPVLLHLLTGRELDQNQAALVRRVENEGMMRCDFHVCNVPALHERQSILNRMVIAIDGPAGAGKSTVARGLAVALGITYLDSGAMYRCVALAVERAGADPDDPYEAAGVASEIEIAFERERVLLDREEVSEAIRSPEISSLASRVSVHPGVREAMVMRQREMISRGPYVAEGRDIGTVVSPESPLKVFLVADDDERARRRAAESGQPFDEVSADLTERDRRDTEREHGALRAADDAVEVDTGKMPADEVVARIADLARERGLA